MPRAGEVRRLALDRRRRLPHARSALSATLVVEKPAAKERFLRAPMGKLLRGFVSPSAPCHVGSCRLLVVRLFARAPGEGGGRGVQFVPFGQVYPWL